MWGKVEFNKNLQVYNKCQSLTGVHYSEWYGNSKLIKFSRIIFIERCNYASITWTQNVCYVTRNLFSTYFNVISVKRLKKYLSWNLLKCYFKGENDCRARFYFTEYNFMFHAPQERNNNFATIDKIKFLKTQIWLVPPNWIKYIKTASLLPSPTFFSMFYKGIEIFIFIFCFLVFVIVVFFSKFYWIRITLWFVWK